MAASEDCLQLTHVFLARIRCLQECIKCFKEGLRLPEALCYVRDECSIKATKYGKITLHNSPEPSKQTESNRVVELLVGPEDIVYVSGEEYCNNDGQWAAIRRIVFHKGSERTFESTLWLLVCSVESLAQDKAAFVADNDVQTLSHKQRLFGREQRTISRWEDVVDTTYCLHLTDQRPVIRVVDMGAVDRLRDVPECWTMTHDEELTQFLCGEIFSQLDVAGNLGCIRDYVESIAVSSYSEDDRGAESLTDNDPDTFWESDGSQGNHWIRLQMKSETVIKTLSILVDGYDDNYLPRRVVVIGGQTGDLKKLNEVTIDQDLNGVSSVLLLENQHERYPVIEIRIKECKDEGIDTRVHAIKIQSSKERDFGLNRDLFTPQHMIRFPKLESYSADQLYRRALLLQRFSQLLDSVLPYVVPSWEFSVSSYSWLEVIRQLLPMSKKRTSLIDVFLRQSETSEPPLMLPKLYVNRRSAVDHRLNPSLDPQYKNSVFSQIYEGLKPRDPSEKPMDFRWPGRYSQWWECKFLDEGIIDQGGGFRDSLSDLAEELCPSFQDVPVPLPFFIRSPNQRNVDANVNRDMYVPNPSCMELHKFEWIGKVMGACLRGKENLVLSLPPFIWKKLAGEHVTWMRDFISVDEAEVKQLENMVAMERDIFEAFYGEERMWTTVLSDGSTVPMKRDGAEIPLLYSDRVAYITAVQDTRMHEFDQQVAAMYRGLQQVVPEAVIHLLTWRELERRICGDPDISIDALRKSIHFEDLDEDEARVQFLWDALKKFSIEDRSRFLRFVTGRRRLPALVSVYPNMVDTVNTLPESSTCSNILYLPNYTSAAAAEEKLRYAIYNCIAIDTDMSPWDDD